MSLRNNNMASIVKSIRVRAVSVPLRLPIVSSVGRYDKWPILLLDVHTSNGIVGHSYLEPYTESSLRPLAHLVQAIGDKVANKPLAPLDIFADAMSSLHLGGRQGMSLLAASAVDMAAWDARAKEAGLPLVTLLGGSPGKVRAYNTCGLWLIPLDELADQARDLVAQGGFTAIKLRLGRRTAAEDRAAIHAVREAVGEQVHIMTDFNQVLTAAEAKLRMHALDNEGLYWYEEPIVYDDLRTCARLTSGLRTPVMLGENIYGSREWLRAIQEEASDLLMADIGRIGGVTGWLRASALAGAAGLPISNHFYAPLSATLLRVAESADWLEWSDWVSPVLRHKYEASDGFVEVLDVPGSGVEWDEEKVTEYQIQL